MRIDVAEATLVVDDEDVVGAGRALRTDDAAVARLAVAESIMFRLLKGLVAPYLHAAQQTTVHRWIPAEATVAARVEAGGSDARGRDVVRAALSVDGRCCVEQAATLHTVGPAAAAAPTAAVPGRREAPPPTDPVALGDELDRWTPTGDELLLYSGWGHPNSHTDDAFARSIGLSSRVVQGAMLQNRLLAVLVGLGLEAPFTVATRFRRPVPMGVEVSARPLADQAEAYAIGTDAEPVSLRVEVSRA